MRLDSELVDVFAEPSDRSTVKAAAKCLNASVSGPPPATANNWRNNNMEQWVLPAPDVPDRMIACGYPVSACWRTASKTIFRSCGANSSVLVDDNVNGFPTSMYGLIDSKIGPTFVYNFKWNPWKKVKFKRKSINYGQLNVFSCEMNANANAETLTVRRNCHSSKYTTFFFIAWRHFMRCCAFSL